MNRQGRTERNGLAELLANSSIIRISKIEVDEREEAEERELEWVQKKIIRQGKTYLEIK